MEITISIQNMLYSYYTLLWQQIGCLILSRITISNTMTPKNAFGTSRINLVFSSNNYNGKKFNILRLRVFLLVL